MQKSKCGEDQMVRVKGKARKCSPVQTGAGQSVMVDFRRRPTCVYWPRCSSLCGQGGRTVGVSWVAERLGESRCFPLEVEGKK